MALWGAVAQWRSFTTRPEPERTSEAAIDPWHPPARHEASRRAGSTPR